MTELTPFDEGWVDPNAAVKAPESPAETTTAVPGGQYTRDEPTGVEVTLKAGRGYEAPWIRFSGPTVYHVLGQFKGWSVTEVHAKYPVVSDAVVALIKEVNGAAIAFQEDYSRREGTPPPRSQGRPANADTPPAPPQEESVPWDNSSPAQPDPMMACEHGTRKLIEWQGNKFHVCPLGKGQPGYCGAVKG